MCAVYDGLRLLLTPEERAGSAAARAPPRSPSGLIDKNTTLQPRPRSRNLIDSKQSAGNCHNALLAIRSYTSIP